MHRNGYLYTTAQWPDLWVDDKNKCSGASENHFIVECWIEEVNLAREIPDLEADKGAAGDLLPADFIGALQKKGLVGRHFMKDHLLNGRLPAPAQAHQQDPRFDFSIQRITEAQHCISTDRGTIKRWVNIY